MCWCAYVKRVVVDWDWGEILSLSVDGGATTQEMLLEDAVGSVVDQGGQAACWRSFLEEFKPDGVGTSDVRIVLLKLSKFGCPCANSSRAVAGMELPCLPATLLAHSLVAGVRQETERAGQAQTQAPPPSAPSFTCSSILDWM